MKIQTAQLCNVGGREINDDTVTVSGGEKGTYVYVGDGLGGYAGGKQASEAAGEALMALAEQEIMTEEALTEAAAKADEAVLQLQKATGGEMKTTMVFLALEEGKARWMHVGDSRLYHFRGGKIQHQTMDHSMSQVAVLMGQIKPKEIRHHPDRNRVIRALGSDSAKPGISETLSVTGKDAFLLCTDGFWEYVYEDEMERTLRKAKNPQAWLDAMETLLLRRVPEHNDNYTAAAIFCG